MLPKACEGCPLAPQARRFFPQSLREGAPVLVVTDTPEADKEQRFEKLAGMPEGSVNVTSAIRCDAELPEMPKGTPAKQDKAGAAEGALLHCRKAHFRVPDGTQLVVARGEYALWSVAGLRSSSSWRGWVVPRRGLGNGWRAEVWTPSFGDAPVLVTAPTADPLAQRLDWRKVGRVLKREWPVPFPGYVTELPSSWPLVSAFDTEFVPETGELTRYSLFTGQGQPWVIEAADVAFVRLSDGQTPTVFMHNVEADILHLERMLGPRVHQFRIEDTMLMDAELWCDRPHDLEYLASLYGRLNRSKHLGYESVDYSAADAIITWDVAVALMKEMKADPISYRDYRESLFPLTPIIMEAEREGLRLRQDRVQEALAFHGAKQDAVQAEAEAFCGFPLNLGSVEQVQRWLCTIEGIGMKPKRGRSSDNRA